MVVNTETHATGVVSNVRLNGAIFNLCSPVLVFLWLMVKLNTRNASMTEFTITYEPAIYPASIFSTPLIQ